jgi:hypothetical protein
MRIFSKTTLYGSISVLLFAGVVIAKEFSYDFMPKGGSKLLVEALNRCKGCDLKTILNSKITKEKWKEYLQGKGALAGMSPKQVETLVTYLAINMPAPKVKIPADPKKLKFSDLPDDGQEILLESCTLCHPLGPVLSEERDVKGWEGIYHTNPHPETNLPKQKLEELINYLGINMPIPDKDIPAELKGKLPGY